MVAKCVTTDAGDYSPRLRESDRTKALKVHLEEILPNINERLKYRNQ